MRAECAANFRGLLVRVDRQDEDRKIILDAIAGSRTDMIADMREQMEQLRAHIDERMLRGEVRFNDQDRQLKELYAEVAKLKTRSLVSDGVKAFIFAIIMFVLMFGATRWAERLERLF